MEIFFFFVQENKMKTRTELKNLLKFIHFFAYVFAYAFSMRPAV